MEQRNVLNYMLNNEGEMKDYILFNNTLNTFSYMTLTYD